MRVFHYTAMTKQGVKQKGIIEAENEKHARELIRQRNLILLTISASEKKQSFAFGKKSARKQGLTTKELALFTRQLATLISAGLPLEEVLTAVAEQTEKPGSKGLILSIRAQVVGGHAFATALGEFPNAFSSLYCATVAAGEKSGHLEKVLLRLADYIEGQFETQQKIMHALIYPSIMILVAIGIVGFLLEFVVPKMVTVYSGLGQNLPTITTVLISISTGLQNYGLYFLIALVIAIVIFFRALKVSSAFRERVHLLLLRIPIIGNSIKVANTARFARTFSILFAAGVPVIDAMKTSAVLITNIPIRKSVEEAADRVKEGANISLALKQTTYFPPMSIHMIASGEASGQLENMLERAANNQDAEISRLIDTTLALFEPMIILIMGAIVLFIVLAVLLPIFQLNELTG